jgi:hypothetical protein
MNNVLAYHLLLMLGLFIYKFWCGNGEVINGCVCTYLWPTVIILVLAFAAILLTLFVSKLMPPLILLISFFWNS